MIKDNEYLYKLQTKRFVNCDAQFTNNKRNACSWILCKYCAKTLLDKIQGHPEFHTKIKYDLVKMLKMIRKYMQDGLRLQPALDHAMPSPM